MLTRTHIVLLLLVAIVIWGAVLVLSGIPVTLEHAKPFAITVTALSTVCVLFDRVLWKWIVFKGWLVQRPNLQGTWKVILKSNWVDPATQEAAEPITCVMVVRQTFSTFSARLFTPESNSFLVASKIVLQNDGVFQLTGVYQNTPRIELRGERSEIHYGAILLELEGDPPASLQGHYWTDRGSRGSLHLSDRKSSLAENLDKGLQLFSSEQLAEK